MANLTFDPTLLKPSAGAQKYTGVLGESAVAGDVCWRHPTTGHYWKGKADHVNPQGRNPKVMLLNDATEGQVGIFVEMDEDLVVGVTSGHVAASGDVLVLSTTAGKMQPAPASANSTAVVMGVMKSATVLNFRPLQGGGVPAGD